MIGQKLPQAHPVRSQQTSYIRDTACPQDRGRPDHYGWTGGHRDWTVRGQES